MFVGCLSIMPNYKLLFKIHKLSVEINCNKEFTNKDIDGLMEFILKLSYLKEINLCLY